MRIRDYIKQHAKTVTYGVIGFAGLVSTGLVLRGRSDAPKYLTAQVTRGSITAVVQATGTINPLTTVPVGSYVSGTVKYIFADFNTRVHAGQVLAQLDPAIYEAQVITARGNLANAMANKKNLEASVQANLAAIQADEANVSKLQADLEYARANARRVANLFKQGIFAEDQNDLTQSNLAQAEAAVRAAHAQLSQARAQLEQVRAQVQQAAAQVQAMTGALRQAETNLRYTTILSPIDGTVVARNITVGQSVAASLQAPNVFTIAQDLKRMQVYAKTDESDTGSIRVGARVSFQVDAFPAETFHGQVSAVRLNAYTVQNVVTYDTVIDFENPGERLLPGETAYVTIPTGHAENALEIPNAALSFTPELPFAKIQELYAAHHISREASTTHQGGWQVVWKHGPEGQLRPVAVKTGITDYNHTQVLEGNLKEGDVLVTAQEIVSGNENQRGARSPFGGPRRRR